MTPGRSLSILLLRIRSLFSRRRVEHDLDRELAFHIGEQIKENVAKGMSPHDAETAARRMFGASTLVEEECRDMRRTSYVENFLADIRYAIRNLAHSPGFAMIVILTLALGIGATSAIFSAIQGVLLRPLPYPEAGRLMRIYFQSDTQPKFPLNPNDFHDFRERNRVFESIAAISRHDLQLSGNSGEPAMLRGFDVTAGYFHTLGLTPARGREFSTADEMPAHRHSVILSDRLWRTRFASDPNILGRTIILNSQPFEVIGIMPPGVQHPGNNYQAVPDGDSVDIWTPFTFDSPKDRGSHYLDAFGRLRPGVSQARANANLTAVLTQLEHEHTGKGWRIYVVPLYREMVGRTEPLLLVLFGAVGLLLLIACVNAANLLLARASGRVREIAIRSALGAARTRIVRQLLTESLVIALAAAPLGTLLAMAGVRALVALLPAGFPRSTEIKLDGGVFLFALSTAIVTGLFFGLAPALTASRSDLQQNLRESARSVAGGARQLRLRNFLVVGETSLACLLLIGAGLMLHSFVNLLNTDPNFRPQRVLTAMLSLPYERYKDDAKCTQFYDALFTNLRSIPGVEYAGAGSDLPWTGYDGNADGFIIEGNPNAKTTSRYHVASPDYFRALGIPLIAGRSFDGHEQPKGPYVVVINETFANRYWPGKSALGKRIAFDDHPKEQDWIQVIGVVRDVKDQPDSASTRPAFWMPHQQQPDRSLFVVIRSSQPAAGLATQFRTAVRQLDPSLALADLRTMNNIADDAFAARRFSVFLVGLFAILALALAAFGMYGVISYAANQRMQEFGIRMALGAQPQSLVRIIVAQGLKLSAAGILIGSVCALGAARLLHGMLYEVGPVDPLAFAVVALLALVTAAVAGYIPARRASGADPIRALRSE